MISENVYKIKFDRLVTWLIPMPLRRPVLIAFIRNLITPINYLYSLFTAYRSAKIYHLTITPQVCFLERLLNDRWDNVQRRIYITDAVDYPPTYLYKDEELKPVYLYQNSEGMAVYLYTDNESGELSDDFVVWVPVSLVFEEAEMISLVKVYKLAGTKFKVQRF